MSKPKEALPPHSRTIPIVVSPYQTLIPRPVKLESDGTRIRLERGVWLRDSPESSALKAALESLPIELDSASEDSASVALTLKLDAALKLEGATRREGYRLEVDPSEIRITGSDEAGLFYGLKTLAALIALESDPQELSVVTIEDWPDFQNRAVSFDVSRDKVPSMETLFELIDWLASLKINQFQLYMEHVFAYEGHEEVWEAASAFTGEEIRALDSYCRERFIDLVPSQNSLAHFHRWLKHDRYRPLSEVPEGIEHPFSRTREPFSLCPTDPGSLELIGELYGQLLPNFSSKLLHVGLDEPMDLGTGRSKPVCQSIGKQRVFLDYLNSIRDLANGHGRRIQFWAEWILSYPEFVPELPVDVIAMAWGYEAQHPFDSELETLAASVDEHYVCPGTSSWNSVGGRTTNALANLLSAARAGVAHGSSGYMITDWGDYGHWQPLPVSYLGFLMGAAVAWNAESPPSREELAATLSRTIFEDASGQLGRVALELGDAHLAAKVASVNGSAPFFLIHFAEEALPHERMPGLTSEGLEDCLVAIDDALSPLDRVTTEQTLPIDEFRWCGDVMKLGCRLGLARLRTATGDLAEIPGEERAALAGELRGLADRHRELWARRNRPGGLADSVERFERLANLLAPA